MKQIIYAVCKNVMTPTRIKSAQWVSVYQAIKCGLMIRWSE